MIRKILNLSPWKLATLSGLLLGLSFPPLKLGILAWIACVPLLRALHRTGAVKGAALGYLSALVTIVLSLYWLSFNSGAPFPVVFASMMGAALYLSLFWAAIAFAFCLLETRTGKGLLLLPLLWVAGEYAMSLGPLGFPWSSLATTQTDYLPLIQLSEFTGIYGITFLILTMNVLLYRHISLPPAAGGRHLHFAFLIMATSWLFGYLKIATINGEVDEGKRFTVALVQPNVGPHEKWAPERRYWVMERLDSMFTEAARLEPQMIVWPESATPFYLRRNFRQLRRIKERVTETGMPLLTGAVDWEMAGGERKFYNSVFLFQPDLPVETYHKIQLVPMGEYNPLSAILPVSEKLSLGHFTRGKSHTVFEVGEVHFSAIICFESAFPQLVRKFVTRGARLLCIVVNDGWFGNTSEPYQHAALARFRAVEFRIPVVRCANTGISAIYDPSGEITNSLPVDTGGIISAGVIPGQGVTFYGKHGDLFSHLCLFVATVSGLIFWTRKR